MKVLKWMVVALAAMLILGMGVTAAAVLTIDVDAEMTRLEEAHERFADGVRHCSTESSCLDALTELEASAEAPISSLRLASRVGNEIPSERLKKIIAGGRLVACGDAQLARRPHLSPEGAETLCARYRAVWNDLRGPKRR